MATIRESLHVKQPWVATRPFDFDRRCLSAHLTQTEASEATLCESVASKMSVAKAPTSGAGCPQTLSE